ncbi:MAG: PSD1 and planctomycete cytochrome C domain-containing protein [Verrucomicrobiota bacterium]
MPSNRPTRPADEETGSTSLCQIRPILSENCFACHGPDEKKRKAGLRLDIKAAAFAKLKSETFALVPGDLEKSQLIARIVTQDEDERMPPAKSGKHLTQPQIDLLRQWVSEGAEYKEHWSYVRPEHPPFPEVRLNHWPRNGIDYFVLSRLESESLRPSPEASREALIRRVSLDLTGLPPTVAEVEDFLRDNRVDAYEHLVERLLSSPHYGERWARPWLDQARYADSNGYEADYRRSIWPYRDWVISALNRDLPFDQFTIEQLAGDLLPNPTRAQRIATGFHRNTMVNTEGGTDEEEFRVAAIVDRVNTTFSTWMGTTMACAQCHSHKYDPFTQREYYQIFAFFNQTKDKGRSNDPELELPSPEQQVKRDELRAKIEPLEKVLNTPTVALDQAQAAWEGDLQLARQRIEAEWLMLEPESFEADGGVILTRAGAHALLAGGALPDASTYTIVAQTDAPLITAVRVEALTDPQLPHQSCGRSEEGDFVLTELTVQATPLHAEQDAPAAPPQLGEWHLLGPFQAGTVGEAFSRDFIGSSKIDLKQTFEDGKIRWTPRTDLNDGQVHELLGENAATYLHRTITTAEARPLLISLGSDDGLQVWLNGKKVLSREVERAVAPNQDSLELQLAKGENQLLLKINNGAGDSGFYFAVNEDQSSLNRLAFETAYADFAMENYGAKEAVDGKPKTGWSIAAHEATNRVDHQAVFVAKKPLGFQGGTRLTIRLKQESERRQHLLGKFRLSISTAPTEEHQIWAKAPAATRALLAISPEERTSASEDELARYYRSVDADLDKVRTQIADLRKQEPKDVPSTLVMEAVGKSRTTHVLLRGNHLNPSDEVQPGTPSILHAWPAGLPVDRLGFARWLVDPANPLVGRVTMNRIWAQYFGRGIVETSEEFGAQGEFPTHPKLLDWLATELVEQGWSLKAMHRLIVTSATYRQSSDVTPEVLERDPFNRLFARGPRFRLEAEMLRDMALAVGGLLSEKIGGPSVFPHQPDGVWNSPYNGERWNLSKDGDQFRRGLYTFWRRTAPYASFAAFDAPSREVTCERRPRSNTPIQSLVTLNDPAFMAAANGLAGRILREGGGSLDERLAFAFECCLARRPKPEEIRPLRRLLDQTLERFARDEPAARAISKTGLSASEATEHAGTSTSAERAAWAVISNVLLNLDETLTKG